MINTAFPYSGYVTGNNFVGRKADVTLLGNLLGQSEHVMLAEPPKSGVTSLVQQTLFSMRMSGKEFQLGSFSVQNIRTARDFLLSLGNTVMRMAASSADEYARIADKYFGGTHFVFDPQEFGFTDMVLSLNWDVEPADIEAMLRFPFLLARDSSKKFIIIADSFHCIGLLDDPDVILRPLDAILKEFRYDKLLSWVFCGNGVNAMNAIFSGIRFSRIVERVHLSPVDELEMADHVHKGFLSEGKVVEKELLQGACRLFKGHVWYINHLASICDSMSKGYIVEAALVDALGCLICVHEPRFSAIMEDLTNHQVSLLRATVDGVTRFSGSEVIRKYGLNSSANVKRVKDALMKKEVLTFDANDNPKILDPLFEYWVKKYYFNIPE